MVQVEYTKEKGLVQKSGSASFTIPNDITIGHPINQVVEANTVASIDFTGVVHKETPANTQINLAGKFMGFHSAAGTSFYLYFDPAAAGIADPTPGGAGIVVNAAHADLDSPAELVTQIETALNGNAAFAKEFRAIDNANVLEIVSLRMGEAGSIVSLNTLQDMVAADESLVSPALTITQGTGSHVINGLGFSEVKSAHAAEAALSFVVVKNLKENSNHGVQKIITALLPHEVEVYNETRTGAPLGTLATGSDILHLVWNGTAWKNIYN